MDIVFLDSLLDLSTSVKDSLGVAALDICLDPDRWVLDFDSLEVYGEFLRLCWVSVWDQFNRQSFVPPTVTPALQFVWRYSASTQDATERLASL